MTFRWWCIYAGLPGCDILAMPFTCFGWVPCFLVSPDPIVWPLWMNKLYSPFSRFFPQFFSELMLFLPLSFRQNPTDERMVPFLFFPPAGYMLPLAIPPKKQLLSATTIIMFISSAFASAILAADITSTYV